MPTVYEVQPVLGVIVDKKNGKNVEKTNEHFSYALRAVAYLTLLIRNISFWEKR